MIKKSFEELIFLEYHELLKNLRLDLEKEAAKVLLPQTILGRIQQGHGLFQGRKKPEVTMEEIVCAIGFSPDKVKRIRQQYLNEHLEWAEDVLKKGKKYATNRANQPLYRIKSLRRIELPPTKKLFKGAVIPARVDEIKWRNKTIKHFKGKNMKGNPLQIGGGKEYVINTEKLKEHGITRESLQKEAHSDEDIRRYKELGIIPKTKHRKGLETIFIRKKKGLGTCDDATLISIGAFYGIPSMIAGFLTDTADTYTKFQEDTSKPGMDLYIANYIEKEWEKIHGEKLLENEEIINIIYLAAKEQTPPLKVSSSHRRFIEIEKGCSQATIYNHIDALRKKRPPEFRIGFERMNSKEFYHNLSRRLSPWGISLAV